MSRSESAIRERIATEVRKRARVQAASIEDLKNKLGMCDVSNTKVDRALRSLHYNPVYSDLGIRFKRIRTGNTDPFFRREYFVFCVGSEGVSAIV